MTTSPSIVRIIVVSGLRGGQFPRIGTGFHGRFIEQPADQTLNPALVIPAHPNEFDSYLLLRGPSDLRESDGERPRLIRRHHQQFEILPRLDGKVGFNGTTR